jgi:hypothetical protein
MKFNIPIEYYVLISIAIIILLTGLKLYGNKYTGIILCGFLAVCVTAAGMNIPECGSKFDTDDRKKLFQSILTSPAALGNTTSSSTTKVFPNSIDKRRPSDNSYLTTNPNNFTDIMRAQYPNQVVPVGGISLMGGGQKHKVNLMENIYSD